ncbi:TPA: protein adenylyltransferase SelO [Photobacterium damselae]
MKRLDQLVFNNTFRQLPDVFGQAVTPIGLDNAFLVSANPDVAALLELNPEELQTPSFVRIFSGNQQLMQFEPIAMKYTGHQFGQYNPDLGDGRGLLLGEVVTDRGQKWDLHLKGSGKTPYSRMGDGRAVLRSSIREYLASAAMSGLGIPTTHALAIIGSETPVYREQQEYGATLIRVAESHIRFGHFEYLFFTRQYPALKRLMDYVIDHHYLDLKQQENPYQALFDRICETTAEMIAAWQAVGFAHGVMNTDNMSILGLTFDYGPYAFLDDYIPNFICNHSDYSGRYAFNQQPGIGLWNLTALGYAFSAFIDKNHIESALEHYQVHLQERYSQRIKSKLGLTLNDDGDSALGNQLFTILAEQEADYTLFFRTLSSIPYEVLAEAMPKFEDIVDDPMALAPWLTTYKKRIKQELTQQTDLKRLEQMKQANPKFILRNYLAQQAIDHAERGHYEKIEALLHVLHDPFSEHLQFEHLAQQPPYWGKHLPISCSS